MKRQVPIWSLLLATALTSGLMLAGCAQAEPETPVTPSPTPGASGPGHTPSPTPPPVVPSPSPTEPDKGETTLTGTVEKLGIEGGCTALRTDAGKVYELKGGDPAVLKAGARVTVRGKVRSDVMTICQIGPVFEVTSSQPK